MKTLTRTILATPLIALPAFISADELHTGPPQNYGAGFMFDIQSLHIGDDLRLHEWWYYFEYDGNTDPVLRFYWREGTYIGHENSSKGWNLLGEQTISNKQNGQLRQVMWPIMDISFGETIGIYTVIMNFDPNGQLTAGMGFRPGDFPTVIENSELRFTGGTQRGSPLFTGGNPFTTQVEEGYLWAGMIATAPVPEPSTLAIFGIGIGILALRKRKRRTHSQCGCSQTETSV